MLDDRSANRIYPNELMVLENNLNYINYNIGTTFYAIVQVEKSWSPSTSINVNHQDLDEHIQV